MRVRLRLAALSLLGSMPWLHACEVDQCCNSCSRLYTIGDPAMPLTVGIVGIDESDDECAIDELPRAFEDGEHTLLVTIETKMELDADLFAYGVTVDRSFGGDRADPECGSSPALDAASLVRLDVAVGEPICMVDVITQSTVCTEKECGGR